MAKNSTDSKDSKISAFIKKVVARDPSEKIFHQAMEEVIRSVYDAYEQEPLFQKYNILERIVEPDRVIEFRVPWVNDSGQVKVNRGYRVQFNNAIGPYKGGLRFHPSVNLDILKFLGFEQIFKNSLTGLMMGGGKGGSDFDPKGKSDAEVMRFCQSFMIELFRHVGPHMDVPAGDIGVGGREIGFLFGMYKKLRDEFSGVLTGKGIGWGGSLVRPEATGYGLVYFVLEMLGVKNLTGKTIAISGSGNVAQYAAEKAFQLGGRVVTLSDSNGTVYNSKGFNRVELDFIMNLKNAARGRIKEYAENFKDGVYFENKSPWQLVKAGVKFDVVLPCATQNELNDKHARDLIKYGTKCVVEGANMPSTPESIAVFHKAKILFAPGKASNAGGVAVSGLEMAQDSSMLQWTREQVDEKLRHIMKDIHSQCVKYGASDSEGFINYVKGANVAGFLKVARAMVDQGVV